MPAADLGALPVPSSGLPAGHAPSSALLSVHNFDILAHIPCTLDFDADNYGEWKDAMLFVLAQFGATDHVDPGAPGEDADEEEWMLVDARIVLWIYSTISEQILDEVMAAHSTAHQIWTQLRDFFDYEDYNEQGFDVREEFRNAAQGDMSVDDYCWRMKALADALAGLGEPVEDRVLTLHMIRGLSPRFEVIGAALLAQSSLPCFMQAFARLHLQEYNMNHGQDAQ